MDYLDPAKRRRHSVLLGIGYVCITVAVLITAVVLLYQAYGFGFGKDGTIIQNGLVFFSSQPNPAKVYVDGKARGSTNTRLFLPTGTYKVEIRDSGYRTWQRTIDVEGGQVAHFDYPLLFPQNLTTTSLASYEHTPSLYTQSPNQRWLLVGAPASLSSFTLYDLNNSAKPVTSVFALPAGLLSSGTAERWSVVQWADDNRHVLLEHRYGAKHEYILINLDAPEQSVNLNRFLALDPVKLTLDNVKYDSYYFTTVDGTLESASLNTPAPAPLVQRVLNYQTYGGDDTVLYATAEGSTKGKTSIRMLKSGKTYTVRTVPAGKSYPLDFTTYSGTVYVAVGSSSDNRLYIYQNPVAQLSNKRRPVTIPLAVLRVDHPSWLSFSSSGQYIVVENGTHFGAYDILGARSSLYTVSKPLTAPQTHAFWLDNAHLGYASGGKLIALDYDGNNRQSLMTAKAGPLAFLTADKKYAYTLAPDVTTSKTNLTQTPLLLPDDL